MQFLWSETFPAFILKYPIMSNEAVAKLKKQLRLGKKETPTI